LYTFLFKLILNIVDGLTYWKIGFDQWSCAVPDPVSTKLGNHLRASKSSQCRTSHPGLISLAILLWMSTN